MVLAIAAVLDVVQIIAGLLAKQAQTLGTGDVKLLLTTGLVALHTRPNGGVRRLPFLLTNVTTLQIQQHNLINTKKA